MSGPLKPIIEKTPKPFELNPSDARIIPFHLLCEVVLKDENVDVLFLGDTDHYDSEIQEYLMGDSTLKSYFNSKVDLMMLELTPREMSFVVPDSIFTSDVDYLYHPDLGYVPCDTKLTDEEKNKLDSLNDLNILRNQILKSNGFDIAIKPVDPQPHLSKAYGMVYDTLSPSGYDIYLSDLIDRLDLDSELNSTVKALSKSFNKAVLIYGDGHGSAIGDDLLEDEEYNLVKISVYPSMKDYHKRVSSDQNLNLAIQNVHPGDYTRHQYGVDQPHMIYLMDSKQVYFTEKIQEELKLKIHQNSSAFGNDQKVSLKPPKADF